MESERPHDTPPAGNTSPAGSTPELIWVQDWAHRAGVPPGVALIWARSGQLEGACRLPGGHHLVLRGARRQSARRVPAAPWVRVAVPGRSGAALLNFARRAGFTAVAAGSAVFAPLEQHTALLKQWTQAEALRVRWVLCLAVDQALAPRGWSRAALLEQQARFSAREWAVLSVRYGLLGSDAPRSLTSTARILKLRLSETHALERAALSRRVATLTRQRHAHPAPAALGEMLRR